MFWGAQQTENIICKTETNTHYMHMHLQQTWLDIYLYTYFTFDENLGLRLNKTCHVVTVVWNLLAINLFTVCQPLWLSVTHFLHPLWPLVTITFYIRHILQPSNGAFSLIWTSAKFQCYPWFWQLHQYRNLTCVCLKMLSLKTFLTCKSIGIV